MLKENGSFVPIASASGFSIDKYTVTGTETANLGNVGNVVYKFSKGSGKTVAANAGQNKADDTSCMDYKVNTTNKMEYYFDKIELTYQDDDGSATQN